MFNVNANPAPSPMTTNPYTQKSAQQAFNASVNNNAQQASKIKLWAIRIFSDIASVLTQPAVLLTTAAVVTIVAVSIPGVNVAVVAIAMALNLIAAATFAVGLHQTLNGKLNQLSQYHAAKADLAKAELNNRQGRFAGQGQAVGYAPAAPQGQPVAAPQYQQPFPGQGQAVGQAPAAPQPQQYPGTIGPFVVNMDDADDLIWT